MIGIAGGTGFIGTHLLDALRSAGFSLRLLVRDGERAHQLAQKNVEAVVGDLDNTASLKQLCAGCDTVIHLVGLIREAGSQTWDHVHRDGTRKLLDAAKQTGVKQFIYNSAVGASPDAKVGYMRTKYEAEEMIKTSGIPYTIFRPSFVAGPGDKSINFFAKLIRWLPVVVVIDAGVKFQPVFIVDLVQAIRKSIAHPAAQNQTFEVGGPDTLTMKEIYATIARVLDLRRIWITIHPRQMVLAAKVLERLPNAPLTLNQLKMLEIDGRCNTKPLSQALQIHFTPFEEALRLYLA